MIGTRDNDWDVTHQKIYIIEIIKTYIKDNIINALSFKNRSTRKGRACQIFCVNAKYLC